MPAVPTRTEFVYKSLGYTRRGILLLTKQEKLTTIDLPSI